VPDPKDIPAQNLDSLLYRLRDLVQERSITQRAPGEADFILASGARSRYYCDTRRVTLSPEGARLTGEVLFRLLDGEAEAVGGLALGAAFIAPSVALVSAQHGRPIYAFTVRAEQKKHGTEEKVAQSFHPDGRELLCPGRRIAVVDDVVTQGGSILKAIEAVEARQCELLSVITLVDRNQGGGDLLRQRRLPYFALFNADPEGNLTIDADLLRNPSQPRAHRGSSS
jgi:orotate phosphoribosyltransferase